MGTNILSLASAGIWSKAASWWMRLLRMRQRAPKRLRLCESLALGDRRFVAVVQFERNRFLLGGTESRLVLLSRLENSGVDEFATVPDDGRGQP